MTRKEINIYLRRVKWNCPFAFRKRLLEELRGNLLDYWEKNPEGTMDEVIEIFGAPETFAYNYILSMEDEKRQKLVRRSARIKIFSFVVLVLWLVILAIKVVGDVRENARSAGYYYEEVVVYDNVEDWE